ncbi:MAG: hypothetical protein ACRENE_05960 [Polyangiaceae bacterium]
MRLELHFRGVRQRERLLLGDYDVVHHHDHPLQLQHEQDHLQGRVWLHLGRGDNVCTGTPTACSSLTSGTRSTHLAARGCRRGPDPTKVRLELEVTHYCRNGSRSRPKLARVNSTYAVRRAANLLAEGE